MINPIPAVIEKSAGSGMPAYGRASGAQLVAPAPIQMDVSTCARTRHAFIGTAMKGFVKGTSAWSPPGC